MLIELHMLKSFPPTNLNRDESGSPKSCFFGGCQRGRISSQSLKHSWRNDSELQKLPMGIRTRRLADYISEKLIDKGLSKEYVDAVKPILADFGKKEVKEKDVPEKNQEKKKKDENGDALTAQIMFFSQQDIDSIAKELQKLLSNCSSIKQVKGITVKQLQEALKGMVRKSTVDMALFGRMITDVAFKNIEASLQVAHAISTHSVNMESDFFTAVDDLQRKYGDDSGSAMMGDVDYNSCCYYFYASLDTDQLLANLNGIDNEDEVIKTLLPRLVSAMVFTNPSGKQNSFAGHALPGVVCVELKDRKVPISHANAFEKPIRSRDGYMRPSAEALVSHMDLCDRSYGIPLRKRLWFAPEADCAPMDCIKAETLGQLVNELETWLGEA